MKKAQEKQEEYLKAEENCRSLDEAVQYYEMLLVPGLKVQHRSNGEGIILDRNKGNITVQFKSGVAGYDLRQTIAGGYLKFDDPLSDEKKQQYKKLCENSSNILMMRSVRQKELKEYSDILE